MLALFAAIGFGYAIGRISIAGFSLGVGAVLFAGLALGAVAPQSAPPGMVNSIGLVMFLYGIGIQYGAQFFAGLKGPGLKWNLLAAFAILASLAVALVLGNVTGISPAHSLGLFVGSLVSTPALQAAIDTAGNRDPAIGYSLAYPLGVIVPILCLFAYSRLYKPRLEPEPAPIQYVEIALQSTGAITVADLSMRLPAGVELVSVRQGGVNSLADPHILLATGDAVLLVGLPAALEQSRHALGRLAPGRLSKDRGTLDVARFFVSRSALVGQQLGRISYPDGLIAKIAEVRRGDVVLFPDHELVLEYGDRVGVIAPRESIPALRKHFGDSMKSTSEFSYISVGVGMSLGVLLGLVKIPIPGVGAFSLGTTGGPLCVALVLGRLGRTGSVSWHIPMSANLTLRNFGLTIFLAAVGLGAGAPFVRTVASTGVTFLLMGIGIVFAAMLVILLLGTYLFKMSTDELFGLVPGTTGNPAILAYANRSLSSSRVDVAYATIYPTMTIFKIIAVQVVLALLSGPTGTP